MLREQLLPLGVAMLQEGGSKACLSVVLGVFAHSPCETAPVYGAGKGH